MAGQSTTEFGAYSSYLSSTTRPAGYTSYLQITELLEDSGKSARYLADMRSTLDALGDAEHVVLPHVSLSLTGRSASPSMSTVDGINAGLYDTALVQFAAAIPLLGRPLFLRVGYEFNGHWNNYSAPAYIQAWRRIEHALAKNATTRATIALVWDMSCDAIAPADPCTTPAECWAQYWPGDDVVDWAGVNVFQAGRGKPFSSMPNSTCVLGFADEARKREFPVLIAESFPRYVGTTNGEASWEGWFAPFFDVLLKHPAVQGWSYIDRDCRPKAQGGTRSKCVGGLWGDARIEPRNASYVGTLYQQAIATVAEFVHAGTLAATCEVLGVAGCGQDGDLDA